MEILKSILSGTVRLCALFVCARFVPVSAQWLHYPTPGDSANPRMENRVLCQKGGGDKDRRTAAVGR